MTDSENIKELEETVMAIIPLLEEIAELKKFIDLKKFEELTEKLKNYDKNEPSKENDSSLTPGKMYIYKPKFYSYMLYHRFSGKNVKFLKFRGKKDHDRCDSGSDNIMESDCYIELPNGEKIWTKRKNLK